MTRPIPEAGGGIIVRRSPALLAAVLVIIVGIPFWGPGTFVGVRTFASHDGWINDWLQLQLPFRTMCAEALREGRLPWWTDRVGGGFPLLADGQAGCLYPPNVLALQAIPVLPAMHLLLLLHQAVAAAGAALLLQRLGVRRVLALAGGVAFAFCAFFVSRARQLNMVETAAWAPWCWLFVEEIVRARAGSMLDRRRIRATVGLIVVAALASLAGHPQIAYYHGLVLALWVALRLRGAPWPHWSGVVSSLTVAAAITGALAAPQLVPTWALSGLTTRVGGMGAAALVQDVPPRASLTWIRPFAFGDPSLGTDGVDVRSYRSPGPDFIAWWELVAWVGTLPWLVLGLRVLRRVGRHVGWAHPLGDGAMRRVDGDLLVVFGFTLVASWGHHTPFGTLLHTLVPGYDLLRAPGRLSLHGGLALLALGGRTLTALLSHRRAPRHLRANLALAAAAWLILEPLVVLFGAQGQRVAGIVTQRPAVLPEPGPSDPVLGPAPRLLSFDPDPPDLVAADRVARGWRGGLEPYERVLHGAPHNLHAAWGWGSLDLFTTLMPRAQLALSGASVISVDGRQEVNLRLLRTWATHRVVVVEGAGIDRPPVRERRPADAAPGHAVEVRELERVEPWARIVAEAAALESVDDPAPDASAPPSLPPKLWTALMAPGHDPSRRTLLHGALPAGATRPSLAPAAPLVPPDAPLAEPLPAGLISRFTDRGDQTTLTLDLPQPAWLIIARLGLPGWVVTVDGVPRPIRLADGGAMAVDLPAGVHHVEFTYEPPGRTLGFTLAVPGGLALLALSWLTRRGRVAAVPGGGPAPHRR